VDLSASYAYADSISDLQLLEMVSNPVAVYPDERLRQVARDRGWGYFHPEIQNSNSANNHESDLIKTSGSLSVR
jgi:hypothetical protein